ncbi:MAG: hypothetical protein H0T79_06480 [Deltaproteobacteria bacterium]|nr:hypothetical protein [Deltaproteobacteria bacterium]
MSKLAFRQVCPPPDGTITVPPKAVPVSDYFLVYDPARRALVYGTAPDHHQVGHAWIFDGTGFTPISQTTYRLGSQVGEWTGLYDPTRKAIVVWGFDHASGPYGVVLGDRLAVILHESAVEHHESMEQTATKIVVTGDRPGPSPEPNWINSVGVFGMDPERGVTVCLTQAGVYELSGDRWTRVADAPAKLPKEVDGECGSAGAVWDVARAPGACSPICRRERWRSG